MLSLAFVFSMVGSLFSSERPNILWITSEDNSYYYVGCYGNDQAMTPNIDRLAREGNRFLHAYSNAPVCAVARSTLITGAYAVTQGTQHMRSRYPIPKHIRTYVDFLREAGYYCSNNWKTDYNFEGDDKRFWDDCSRTAHYRNRAEGQPFFSIFNFNRTHESSVFPARVAMHRENGLAPSENRVDPNEIAVPPLYPDNEATRQDLANYYDSLTSMDQQVGAVLEELEREGLADDTIIFYYSDHGGVLPRSKRYVYDTGTHVPFIVYFPEKWRSLAPGEQGEAIEEVVSFVDFAPTLLALAGIQKPDYMQGRVLFGFEREETEDPYVFLYGDRFDETYKLNRALTDGRFRYIRNFMPLQTGALQNAYPYNIASWLAFKAAAESNQLNDAQARLWKVTQPIEELYDTEADPWELNNLAEEPRHQSRLLEMRAALKRKMIETHDLGLIPEPMWSSLSPGSPIFEYARSSDYDHEAVVELAFQSGETKKASQGVFVSALDDQSPIIRYWGLMGLANLQDHGIRDPLKNVSLSPDPETANRVLIGWIQARAGQEKGIATVAKEAMASSDDPVLAYALNILRLLDAVDSIPMDWYEAIAAGPDELDSAKRLARKAISGNDVVSYR